MNRRLTSFAVTVATSLVLVACSDDSNTADAPADGAAVYAANCSACHGADLRGTERGPSLLSIVYEPNHHPDDSFRSAIQNGVDAHHWDFGPMPMINAVDDAEIDAVIAFIRSTQEAEGFEDYPPE